MKTDRMNPGMGHDPMSSESSHMQLLNHGAIDFLEGNQIEGIDRCRYWSDVEGFILISKPGLVWHLPVKFGFDSQYHSDTDVCHGEWGSTVEFWYYCNRKG